MKHLKSVLHSILNITHVKQQKGNIIRLTWHTTQYKVYLAEQAHVKEVYANLTWVSNKALILENLINRQLNKPSKNTPLISMVRTARERGHIFITIDENGRPYTSIKKPYPYLKSSLWKTKKDTDNGSFAFIGITGSPYNLTCHWTKAIIDIRKLKGVH